MQDVSIGVQQGSILVPLLLPFDLLKAALSLNYILYTDASDPTLLKQISKVESWCLQQT